MIDEPTVTGIDAEHARDTAGLDDLLAARDLPSPVGVEDLEHLATLARRVAVAERIVLRTRDRAARRAADNPVLAGGTALSLHPESIRAAAAALLAARVRLAEAEAEVGTHTEHPRTDPDRASETDGTEAARGPDAPDRTGTDREADATDGTGAVGGPAAPDRTGATGGPDTAEAEGSAAAADDLVAEQPPDWDPVRSRRHALGAGLVGAGGSLGAAGLGADAWLMLLPLLLGLVVASCTLRVPRALTDPEPGRAGPGGRVRTGDDHDPADPPAGRGGGPDQHREPTEPEGSDRLAEVAALTDRAFGGWGAPTDDDPDAGRRAERDLAAEEVRVAERAWQAIAGPGVEPAEVDVVVRRHDPQHQDALVLAAEATAVRAAQRLLDAALDRWTAAWQALGLGPPPPHLTAHDAVVDLRRRATAPLVLSGAAATEAAEVAARLPAAPVLVVRPGSDATVPGPSGPGTASDPGVGQPPAGGEPVS